MTNIKDAQAKYKAGDRLHFTPSADRAPFGTAIAEGDVVIVEVVDHGSATPYSPRFTYVVRALDGSGTQGTDDRELTEIEPAKVRKPAPLSATMSLVLTAVAIGDEDTIYAAKTGTWAALVTRGLVTAAARPTEHKLTGAGREVAEAARAQAAAVAVNSPLTDPADQAAALLRLAEGNAAAVLKILDDEINTAQSLYRDSDEAYHRATRIELFKIIDAEPMEEITIEAITVAQRIDHFIAADKIATEIGRVISDDRRLDLAEVWDFSPNVDRAKLLRALAADLIAFAVAMDAAAGFEALSRTPTECRNCAEPISLRFAEATSSDWKHVKTNERLCGYHFGASAIAEPRSPVRNC